jgi:DNA polymerase IV
MPCAPRCLRSGQSASVLTRFSLLLISPGTAPHHGGEGEMRSSPLPAGHLRGRGKTAGKLRSLERVNLEREFGRYGVRLYELARGIGENPVAPGRPTQSISVEGTFQEDVFLAETEPMIRRLAEKLWARITQRIAHTENSRARAEDEGVQDPHSQLDPGVHHPSCDELTDIALKLRERVNLGPQQRQRLVGVGLSNFRDAQELVSQPVLFE